MSKWPGKYVIGLTGNIATGKSVVRRMLEHLGAYTIDADSLAHRAIARGAPGYPPVVELFGKWILDRNGEIDRAKLAGVVFRDAQALRQLEDIVHPLVEQAAEIFIRRAAQSVVAIEAIKLLESNLKNSCDAIWVTYAPEETQLERLTRKRGLTREQALERIRSQPPQSEKVAAASVVIRNTGSYEDLWKQVADAWKRLAPVTDTASIAPQKAAGGEMRVQRGRPRDSQALAELINRLSGGKRRMTASDVMESFGDKAYLVLYAAEKPVGLAGWQVENLVARTTDLYLDSTVDAAAALQTLLNEVERASQELQAEASLVFPPPELAADEAPWKRLGYEKRTPQTLGVQAWQDAALESMPHGATLYFKQLRQDRVLRPI